MALTLTNIAGWMGVPPPPPPVVEALLIAGVLTCCGVLAWLMNG